MTKKPDKITIRSFLNPVTLLIALILLAGLILAGLAALFLGRSSGPPAEVTPVLTMISAPTQTMEPVMPTASSTPSATDVVVLPEGEIGVGIYVQVSGTNGAGLRMRSDPGLTETINFTALDAEVFLVIDGPVEVDGYTWWLLEAPYDQTRKGWSAGDFLSPIEGE
jgi:hypothetical protein